MIVCKSPVRAALLRMFHHNLTAPLLPDIKIAKRRSNDVNQARTPNTAERNICCPTSVIGAAGRPLYIAQPKDHEIHGTIISEGFVTGSEPAHVGCRGEQKPVHQSQTKSSSRIAASK